MTYSRKTFPELVVERWDEILDDESYNAWLMSAYTQRLSVLQRELMGRLAKPYGLSETDVTMMFLLRGYAKSPVHMSDIWRLYKYTPGAITHRIGRLRKLEFVVTRSSDADSRASEVELTPRGEEVIEAIGKQASANIAASLHALGLSEFELQFLRSTLRKWEAISEAASVAAAPAKKTRAKTKTSTRTKTARAAAEPDLDKSDANTGKKST